MERLKNSSFGIKSYSKSELGLMYSPYSSSSKIASRKLMRWIQRNEPLNMALMKIGLQPTDKVFTPAQVKLIVEVLGEP